MTKLFGARKADITKNASYVNLTCSICVVEFGEVVNIKEQNMEMDGMAIRYIDR